MRRFPKLTVQNTPILLLVLIVLRFIGTVIYHIDPAWAYYYLTFHPTMIFQGEVWRIVSFVMFPSPMGSNAIISLLFLAIISFFYFSIGQSLVMVIGKFKLNFFLISGLILTLIAGIAYYLIALLVPAWRGNADYVIYLSPAYLYPMLFVLFAMMFPDMQFLLMFIIPLKGKWLVFVTLGFYLIDVLQAFLAVKDPAYAWILIAMIIAAILTVLIFLLAFRRGNKNKGFAQQTARQKAATQERRNVYNEGQKILRPGAESRHKCAICGRTEKTNPELEFRYCSKCVGNYEYCSDHLYTHLHKYPNITDGPENGQK